MAKQVLRVFFTYILVFSLTLQSFYYSIMTMEYQLHLPEYLAKCINIDKPQLDCNGQCVFMNKIKEKEEKEAKNNLVAHEYSSLYVHNDYPIFAMYQPNEESCNLSSLPYLINYRFEYNSSIFRPPVS